MKGNFYENERVALFIDGANLYSAARALGFDIDYRRLLKVFREKGRLVRAYYYTALVEDQEYSPIRPLIDWLDYNGYTMVTKPTKEFTDAMGRRKIKGNMDIELAIDVLEMAEHLDHVILFSGDGDFRRLVEAVQRRGLRVSACSTAGAPRSPLPATGTRHTRFVLTLPVPHPPKENDVDPLAGQPRAQRQSTNRSLPQRHAGDAAQLTRLRESSLFEELAYGLLV